VSKRVGAFIAGHPDLVRASQKRDPEKYGR